MNTWKKTTLGEVVAIIDGDRGVNYPKNHEFVNDGYCLFLNAKNVPNDSFSFNEKMFITQEKDSILGKGKLKRGDFVLTTRGTVGNFAFYSEKVPFDNIRINSGMVILRAKDKVIDKGFLKFYLKSHFFTDQVLFLSSGSAQPQLPIRDLCVFEIQIPPLPEQKAIAAVLSSFDDKIELLRRQNKTLEAIAQAIFKEWFVKFKVKGEQLKLNPKTGLPEGWRRGKVEDLCSIIASGGTPSTSNINYYNGNINWFSTKELQDNFLLDSDKKITKDGLRNSSAKMFPMGSVVMALYAAPTVGRLGILGKESTFNQAACGFVANEEVCCYEYIYLYLLQSRIELNNLANGAAQQNLNVGIVKNFPAVIPTIEIMQSFKAIVVPIFAKKFNNTLQIQTLSKLRDTLLPKLMKGEIRVKREE